MKEMTNCFFCNSVVQNNRASSFNNINYTCPNCGQIEISDWIIDGILNVKYKNELYKFASIFRNRNELGENFIEIHSENIEKIINNYKEISVEAKSNLILLYIARKTQFPGEAIILRRSIDYPLASCKNFQEFTFLIDYLSNKEFESEMHGDNYSVKLTVEGWSKVEKIKSVNPNSIQAFVAMWFDQTTKSIYENGISKAILNAGFSSLRIDLKEHTNYIPDEIMSEIRRSKFIVADFTGQRAGVYFESGFALGLGLPVIWTCKHEEINELHFDIKQYNHIDWIDEDDLYNRLYNRIRAVIY